jgi:hypothetical protein
VDRLLNCAAAVVILPSRRTLEAAFGSTTAISVRD